MAYPYYPFLQNQMQMGQVQQNLPQVQQSAPVTQNTGFVSVPSEAVARNYPVAYGNSVTFKNENAPYIYTKTMGFSQLEQPTFEKYRIVKEDAPVENTEQVAEQKVEIKDHTEDIERLKSDLVSAKVDIDNLKADIDDLRAELEDATDTISSLKKKLTNTKKVQNDG
jgi:hypothetical protein